MDRPLIGITTYGRDEEGKFSLPSEYVDAVRRAGGVPLLLPPGENDAASCLASLHGLILAGGGDIHPKTCGGALHETSYMMDRERDTSEIAMVKDVLATGMPTLAICRGAQIVNAALGGSLYSHIPDVVGEAVPHRLPPREPTAHKVSIVPGSMLAKVIETTECSPQSWHHQAVNTPAAGLKVTAHAPDGIIEAFEKPDHPWLIAVQWHPELTAAADPGQQ
ncbi:MAG: gamma-glutamyl-gamma-aminobutyrate hydrolase family protein [Lentisphaerae bacterium]|nr:gamma-glutamyl-gamma-aminobutyrate hydrolase family protein [Lentisphaerota bacterium]